MDDIGMIEVRVGRKIYILHSVILLREREAISMSTLLISAGSLPGPTATPTLFPTLKVNSPFITETASWLCPWIASQGLLLRMNSAMDRLALWTRRPGPIPLPHS